MKTITQLQGHVAEATWPQGDGPRSQVVIAHPTRPGRVLNFAIDHRGITISTGHGKVGIPLEDLLHLVCQADPHATGTVDAYQPDPVPPAAAAALTAAAL